MTLTLQTQKREAGKAKNAALRAEGLMPIIAYGPKDEAISLTVVNKEFAKVWKQAGESSVITLEIDGTSKDALIQDVSVDPVTEQYLHADFYLIEKGKKVQVAVPLTFVGEAPAVKTLGGALVKVMHELEIEAMPKDLPHDIEVSLSGLVGFDSRIKVADLKLPAGVVAITDAEEVIALVGAAGEEVAETDTPIDLSAIEVEKKGKKEEDSEAAAE
jgi:large subunit ribosomal protein L25